jgi:putative ABC transport system permease protein
VTPEFFRVFEVQPVLGRLFGPDEEKPGNSAAVVISHAYWLKHFGTNPGALDKTIRIFGKTLSVVGVMPVGFHFPDKTDIWIPANTVFLRRDRARGITIS